MPRRPAPWLSHAIVSPTNKATQPPFSETKESAFLREPWLRRPGRSGTRITPTPHSADLLIALHSHHSDQFPVPIWPQRLHQIICHHVLHWAILQTDLSLLHSISNKVVLNINVLRASMMLRVVGERNSALTIGVDAVLVANVVPNFFEKAMYPNLFLEGVKNSHILRFCGRECN